VIAQRGVAARREVPPRRRKRGETRDALLRARASELFLERGYDGVSIDDLVRDVGGSKSSVYSLYGGKEGLFVAVMEEVIAALALPVREIELYGVSLKAGLQKFGETLLTALLDERHLCAQRLVIAEARRHPALAESWYRNGPGMVHGVLREFLAAQTQLGRLKPGLELTRVAILFHDMIVFDLLNRALAGLSGHSRQDEIVTTVADAIRLITPGILPRKE
jgi:AcrR family transcriptional regulator